jgi:hypothetical protein
MMGHVVADCRRKPEGWRLTEADKTQAYAKVEQARSDRARSSSASGKGRGSAAEGVAEDDDDAEEDVDVATSGHVDNPTV